MGNCTGTRRLETESETYVFHVTNVDHDEKPVTTGILKVTPSELIYDGQDKDQIVWAWHHVLGFACDGHVFRIKVSLEHCKGNGDYWFTSKYVAALFLRVHNCIFTNNKVEQRQVVETNARSSSLPSSVSPSSRKLESRSSLQSTSTRNGSLTSPSSRTGTPKHKKILHSEVNTLQSTSTVKVDHVTTSMSCETGDIVENPEQETSIKQSSSSSHSKKPVRSDSSDSHRKCRRKVVSQGSNKSGSGSVQSMEPRATSSSGAALCKIAISDVASSGWPPSSSYVNLTPYVNVNTSDSPPPPPLPPKSVKQIPDSPPPPPLPPKSVKQIPIDKFDEESLDGLSGVSCNSEVFLPTQKNESKDEGIADHFLSRQLSSASCSLCDHKSQAAAYCHDCEGLVCAECVAQHQRMSTFANHSLFKRSQPVEEKKNTACSSGTTAVKYSDIIFPSPHVDTQLGSPLASHKRSQSYEGRDMHVVSYSKIDHATSEILSQLKDQRMTERSWSTKERRASMGAKFSQNGVRYSK